MMPRLSIDSPDINSRKSKVIIPQKYSNNFIISTWVFK